MGNTTIFNFADLNYVPGGANLKVKSKKNNITSVYSKSLSLTPAPLNSYLLFSSSQTFTLSFNSALVNLLSGNVWDGILQYSVDSMVWNECKTDITINSSQSGDVKKIYLRGINNTYVGNHTGGVITVGLIVLTGTDISCSGNIETLLDYETVLNNLHPTMGTQCFANLFTGNAQLITAPILPATNLTTGCYQAMFYGCKKLTAAPNLPASILADGCYRNMFWNCSGLITPSVLADGITQLTAKKNCCTQMYNSCTSLNIYTSSSGHTAFYKALSYSTESSATDYQSTQKMFNNCNIDGVASTDEYLVPGTQYYF